MGEGWVGGGGRIRSREGRGRVEGEVRGSAGKDYINLFTGDYNGPSFDFFLSYGHVAFCPKKN